MADEDPFEGIDPDDVEELERLYRQILDQAHGVEATDIVGLGDSVSAVVYADVAEARAEALTPQVLIGEAQLAARVEMHADAIVIPASVDPVVFNRMLTLARKLAVRVGPFAGGYLVNAAWDKTHEQFWQAVSFVALVLRYLSS